MRASLLAAAILTLCPVAQGLPRGRVPPGFMLSMTAPGVDPGEPGDDQGPPRALRAAIIARTGCNTDTLTIRWADTERTDPGEGPSRYDFSAIPARRVAPGRYLIVELDFFGNPWAEAFRFTDIPRYNRLLERWAEAACRYARHRLGTDLFSTGGNERDLVAPQTYQPHFADWHFYYMDPIRAIHAGMKRAHPANRLIIGNLCYSDRDHIGALYCAGAKGNFELLAIHAYGPRGCHVDMEQVIESHEEMAYRGDPHIPILITEGWSCFPLPDSIEHDRRWRHGPRPYTAQEIEHYRQTVLDGWRNLTTPRVGMYDPAWVAGARYFVLNDHWGGRGWAERARPQLDAEGKLQGFLLDGYFIGTTDPDYIKPFLRPWGLIDIEGRPKGDTVAHFPPYIPRHSFQARLYGTLPTGGYCPRRPELTVQEVVAGRPYRVLLELQNQEDTPMTQMHFALGDKTDSDYLGGQAFLFTRGQLTMTLNPDAPHRVTARPLGTQPPTTLGPGQKLRLRFEITFSPELATPRADGRRQRVRPYADLWYVWKGRPYHTDAWLPRVAVAAPR